MSAEQFVAGSPSGRKVLQTGKEQVLGGKIVCSVFGMRAGKEGDEAETQQGACWEDLA